MLGGSQDALEILRGLEKEVFIPHEPEWRNVPEPARSPTPRKKRAKRKKRIVGKSIT